MLIGLKVEGSEIYDTLNTIIEIAQKTLCLIMDRLFVSVYHI